MTIMFKVKITYYSANVLIYTFAYSTFKFPSENFSSWKTQVTLSLCDNQVNWQKCQQYFWINVWNIFYWIKNVTHPSSSGVNSWIFHTTLKTSRYYLFKYDLLSVFHCSMYHSTLCVGILLQFAWKIREDSVVLSRLC